MVHKTTERLVAPMIATKGETRSNCGCDGLALQKARSLFGRAKHRSIQKRAFLFGLLKWSALVLLSFAISGCDSSARQVIALTLVPNTIAPGFNSQVPWYRLFSGGAAVIGSTGTGSSDITASAISEQTYSTPALTGTKTYTLTVTSPSGEVATTTCVVTPTSVAISNISPANQTVAPSQVTFAATAAAAQRTLFVWSANGGKFSVLMCGRLPQLPALTRLPPPAWTNLRISFHQCDHFGSADHRTTGQQESCQNASTTLSVTANYANAYQWKLERGGDFGATGASLMIAGASSAAAGNYTATVSNAAGSRAFQRGYSTVGSTMTANPQSLSIFATQTANILGGSVGSSSFHFPVVANSIGGTVGTAVSGATSSTYTTPAADVSLNGRVTTRR